MVGSIFIRMAIRLSIGLLSLLIYMNILGKMQLAPQSVLDQIGNYVLGGIIGGIIYNLEVPLWRFFMAIFIWGALMLIINYIRVKNIKAKRLIEGDPILLMEDEKFIIDSFEQSKMSLDTIISKLHQMGIFTITDVKTIWLEPNGQLTVVKKDDMDIPYSLIINGQINKIDLRRSNKDLNWIENELSKKGIDDISKVFYCELLNGKLELFLY